MRQRLAQITEIERLRALKFRKAEKELLQLQQQMRELQNQLAQANALEASRTQASMVWRAQVFKLDTVTMTGSELQDRVAELAYLEQLVLKQKAVVRSIQEEMIGVTTSLSRAENTCRQCRLRLQAIQVQKGFLLKQHKKAQNRRVESDTEELFLQRLVMAGHTRKR
jgi:hypothetical protein